MSLVYRTNALTSELPSFFIFIVSLYFVFFFKLSPPLAFELREKAWESRQAFGKLSENLLTFVRRQSFLSPASENAAKGTIMGSAGKVSSLCPLCLRSLALEKKLAVARLCLATAVGLLVLPW